jgi:hypothetical protein
MHYHAFNLIHSESAYLICVVNKCACISGWGDSKKGEKNMAIFCQLFFSKVGVVFLYGW